MEKVVKVGVGLLIVNAQNQVLLGLRKGSHGNETWSAPGGHLEFGESFEKTAVRETKEETNLDIDSSTVKVLGVTNDYFETEDKHYITVFCGVHVENVDVKLMEPNKCTKWRWFDKMALPDHLFLPLIHFLKIHQLDEV